MTKDEMVGWHRRLNGHEFEQSLGDSEGQGAWHAAIHGVAQSWTRLKRFDSSSRFELIKTARLYGATAGQGAEVKKVAS